MSETTLTERQESLPEDPSTSEARPPAAEGLDSSVDTSRPISQHSVREQRQSTSDKLAELIAAGFIDETDAKDFTDEDINQIHETWSNSQFTQTCAPVAADLDLREEPRKQAKKLIATDLKSTQAPWGTPPHQSTPSRSDTGGSSSSSDRPIPKSCDEELSDASSLITGRGSIMGLPLVAEPQPLEEAPEAP